MNEEKAIDLCIKHQDPIGFEYLFNSYRKEAYCHAVAFLANHHDAMDACQECFKKAFLAIPKLEKLKAFYPWFYSILRNHCINVSRKRQLASGYVAKEKVSLESESCKTSPLYLIDKGEEQLKTWNTLLKPSVWSGEIQSEQGISVKIL